MPSNSRERYHDYRNTHNGSVDGPLLVSEKINLQRGSDADGRLARAKDEGILLRR